MGLPDALCRCIVQTQHHGLHVIVVASLAQRRGKRIATHRAGRGLAVHDFATRHNDGHAVAAVTLGRLQRFLQAQPPSHTQPPAPAQPLALCEVQPHHVRRWAAQLHAGGLAPRPANRSR